MESSLSSLAYKGSITGAISEAKQQKKLFVVYISGDNSQSNNLESSTWLDSRVAEAVSECCILLHIVEGSNDAMNFSALYPQKPAPCITAVGYNGVLLWQHEGFVAADILSSSLKKAWETLTSAPVPKAERPPPPPPPEQPVSPTKSPSSLETQPVSVSPMSRPCLDSHKKVKEAQTEEESSSAQINTPSPAVQSGSGNNDSQHSSRTSMGVHLNIKLPYGSSLQVKLSPTDTLRAVKERVDRDQEVNSLYDLAVPYPHKVFSDQDLDKTLFELGLLDRQTLIVVLCQKGDHNLLVNGADSTGQKGDKEGYFSFVRRFFSYVNPFSFLGGGSSSSTSSPDNAQGSQSSLSNNVQQSPGSSNVRNRKQSSSGFGSNIHTLKHDNDSPFGDGNAFWNGNSTQFGGDTSK